MDGFQAYASVLDYQGFTVAGMRDSIWACAGGDCTNAQPLSDSLMTMDFEKPEGSGKIYSSKQKKDAPAEGEYVWQFNVLSFDSLSSSIDSSDTYNVYFRADTTAPNFKLTTDSYSMNPDSAAFIARFKWDSTAAKTPDIRAMRWTLENVDNSRKYELPSLYDVASGDFAVAWDKVDKDSLADGLYRVNAYAIDNALPNKAAYDAVNSLVAKIAGGTVTDADWNSIGNFDLNRKDTSVEFRIDRTAPVLVAGVGSVPVDSNSVSKYAALKRPSRRSDLAYVSEDSLLHISYLVKEFRGSRDSALVSINWSFLHSLDTSAAGHAGDSLWIAGADSSIGSWSETQGLRMDDGDYILKASVRDEAKNTRIYPALKKIRVDRTAPDIESLVSTHLVYPDSEKNFSATIKISEKYDVDSNRTGMLCYYRVTGGNASADWAPVSNNVLHANSVTFAIDSNRVGVENGKRYLTVSCLDAAGNASARTDLFHVGDRYPNIVSPDSDKTYLTSEYIPIIGLAAPNSTDEEGTTVYRLRYRYADSTNWHSENISVVAANQSSDSANISKISQSNEGVLGYLHNVGFPAESKVLIELGVRGCATCEWRTDSTIVTLDSVTVPDLVPSVAFDVSPKAMTVGEDSLDVSLRLGGNFTGSYVLRVYAEDSKGKGLFDKSLEKVFRNSFYGIPADTAKSKGVWFYETDSLYHLLWKGLADSSKIQVSFSSATFGEPCIGADNLPLASGCSVESSSVDYSGLASVASDYLADYPEWIPPASVDSVMELTGRSGHIVMSSEGAFRVAGVSVDTSSSQKLPVYFGSSATDGFNFGFSLNSLDPLQIGWTANPQNEGLSFVWDGLTSTQSYPAAGTIVLYAEVIQDTSENPYMILDTQTVTLELPELKVVLPSLSDFYMIQNDSSKTDAADSGETRVYELASMNISYGITGRDAFVSIYVKDQKGNVVKTLQDSVFTKANSNDKIYSAQWNATDSSDLAVNPGTYSIVISAREADAEDNVVTKSSSFEVSLKTMVPDSSNSTNFVVSEAIDDDGKNRYIPVADYLVKADFDAKYLPSDRLEGVSLNGSVKGTQQVYGYAPKRFSLGIKRHRKQLDLVVIRHLHGTIEYISSSVGWGAFGCSEHRGPAQEMFYIDTLHFTSEVRTDTLSVWKIANDNDGDYGYDDGTYNENYMDMVVLSLSGWETYLNDLSKSDPTKAASIKNSGGSALNTSLYNVIKGRPEVIWSLGKLTGKDEGFEIPSPRSGKPVVSYSIDGISSGCEVIEKDGIPEKTCTYGDSGTTAGYDPNAKLFEVEMSAIENGEFYAEENRLNSDCNRVRFRFIYFNVKMTIPDVYWNAPFGYDNLVNRTIRFDHTNTTIFTEKSSSTDGYWSALINKVEQTKDSSYIGNGSYFDGTSWHLDKTYGLLTPYEMQSLSFFPPSKLSGGENMFLFADEDSAHTQPAYFDLKFYGPRDEKDYFQALALGYPLADSANCDYDKTTNFEAAYGNTTPRCQVSVTSKPGDAEVKRTPLFAGGWVQFLVGRNELWSAGQIDSTIAYPAALNWRDSMKNGCSQAQDWSLVLNGTKPCYKYYAGGSKAHYYFYDFSDSSWTSRYIMNDDIIKNVVNSPAKTWMPDNITYLDASKIGSDTSISNFVVKPNADNYSNGKFYVSLDTIEKLKNTIPANGVSISKINLSMSPEDSSYASFSSNNDTLYIPAEDTVLTNRLYRRTKDSTSILPTPTTPVYLSSSKFFTSSKWMKDVSIDSASLLHLDSSEHSHFMVLKDDDQKRMEIKYKDAKYITVARPKELVELRANLKTGQKYRLVYLKNGVYYSVLDSMTAANSGPQRLTWFDVNRLQGNTQFLLTWGDGGSELYYNNYNLYVGSPVDAATQNSVHSLFGELSVTFPANTLKEEKDVTVRTTDASEYPFDVFNDIPITGPVMEVLPSMKFEGPEYPRIQMKISKAEMDAMNVTPQTLKLYKIDFANKKFVPLENALYGYLDAEGAAFGDQVSDSVAQCKYWKDQPCYNKNWQYILISAETSTFSVFAAMDSSLADVPSFDLQILPEIATTRDRNVQVTGISKYNLYVDDDSLWNDDDDLTPVQSLAYTLDSTGIAHIALPIRGGSIDTNYVFVVAKNGTAELPAAPAVAKALTVPAEFACTVPGDSLWLGLDNGYMAYGASCNHPGYGTVSLYLDDKLVTEIRGENPDTVVYDGSSTVGKIAAGTYESRYLGVSVLGYDLQMAGPRVYTDSARPEISDWTVEESSDVLDRVFNVSLHLKDSESGVASAVITPVFENDTLSAISVLPDSTGKVNAAIRLTRKQLANCAGCRLSLGFRVEDYGHNHSEKDYRSEVLYPFPAALALWYPAREGAGTRVHEFMGTGHDLNLYMAHPWLSDVGLYFGSKTDNAVGKGRVDLGTSDAYTFEARLKNGYADNTWRRVLGFEGTSGLSIQLQARGRSLRIVEGEHVWAAESVIPVEKSWNHIAVTVDSSAARFYVNGELMARATAVPLERELYGTLSMGELDDNSFIGNVADIRMYSGALTAQEVAALSMPVSDDGDEAHIIVVGVNDMDPVNGFSNQFSCSIADNNYFVSNEAGATLAMPVMVEYSGKYDVVLYARSATLNSAQVGVGSSTSSLYSGNVALTSVWRAVTVSNVSLDLTAGTHDISLRLPQGVEIGGLALTSASVHPSTIAWGTNSSGSSSASANKVKTYVRYEGYSDPKMLRPRMRLVNVSSEPINGYSVRYYFRGKDPLQVHASAYFPQDSAALSVHSESARTGYVEWSFGNSSIAVRDSAFYGQGPHFGLFNADWSNWNATDDPSFIDGATTDFVEDEGIIVLDKDNKLIGGSCVEMEDAISAETKARVLAADVRNDAQGSEIHLKVENQGNVALKNFDVHYYFYVEEGIAPIFDVNYLSACSSANMESLGNGRWQVNFHCENALGAGNSWNDPLNFSIHLKDWMSAWNAADDPSHSGLGASFAEAAGITVFDSLGNRIYGSLPVWPAAKAVTVDSVVVSDNGYGGSDSTIFIVRTEDGLMLTLKNYTSLSLDLVNAIGTPVKSIYSGTLAPGEQLVSVDWTGINMNTTYLVLKVNGIIKSTKLLSLL